MADTIHWADVIAEKVSRMDSKYLVAAGTTPSGHIHISNMREVVIANTIHRAILDKGAEADFILISNNCEALGAVYPFLPESYSEHVGKPISDVPCPCGNCKNYAEHFLTPFLKALSLIGINPKVYRTDEMYKTGRYNEAIKTALINRDAIVKILEEASRKTMEPEWSPFSPRCDECGKITTTKVAGFNPEAETVNYACICGHSGVIPMTGGKLTWNVEWPALWAVLGTTVEPFGKENLSKGSSYDTEKRIVKEVFEQKAPYPVFCGLIKLGKQRVVPSSLENAFPVHDILKVIPPEVLHYLIIRTKPEKSIKFDLGQSLLTLADEYEQLKTHFREKDSSLGFFEKRIYELSRLKGVCQSEIPFKQMITIYQVARGDFDQVLKVVKRSGFSTENEKCIKELIHNVSKWLEIFAPPFTKFNVKEKVPVQAANLSKLQKAFLSTFAAIIETTEDISGKEYHMLIYSAQEEGSELNRRMIEKLNTQITQNIDPADLFKAIYISLLGQSSGPRAGWFLSSFEKEFLVKRFKDASTYTPETR